MRNNYILLQITRLLIISASLFLPVLSFAITENITGSQLGTTIYPENPGSFTNVSINLISYRIDLSSSNISWSVNGKKQLEGIGKTNLQIKTGPVGKKILIDIIATSQNDIKINKTLSMIPADVDILWHSTGNIPPFYKGKAGVLENGTVELVAFPNFISEAGQLIDPSKLIYSWTINSTPPIGGFGVNKVYTTIDKSSRNSIYLEVRNLTGEIRVAQKIMINSSTPRILYYQSRPLTGLIYNNALNREFHMDDTETLIHAEPYFFEGKNQDEDTLNYDWFINEKSTAPTIGNGGEINLRQPTDSQGTAQIRLNISGLKQRGSGNRLLINFGRTSQGF